MASLGDILKAARERKNLTLEHIAEQTRVKKSYLEALELNNFQEIGASVYVKAFLRHYAKAVELDPEKIVGEFQRQYMENESHLNEAIGENIQKMESSRKLNIPKMKSSLWGVLLVSALVVAGTLYFLKISPLSSDRAISSQEEAPSPISAEVAESTAQPAATTQPNTAANVENSRREPRAVNTPAQSSGNTTQPPANAKHTLILKATGACHVTVTTDGRKEFEDVMVPGETRTWHAQKSIRLRLGNAGAVAINYNGKSIPKPGRNNEIKELAFP